MSKTDELIAALNRCAAALEVQNSLAGYAKPQSEWSAQEAAAEQMRQANSNANRDHLGYGRELLGNSQQIQNLRNQRQ